MALFELLFSFSGRINREKWWLTQLLIFGVFIIVSGIAALLDAEESGFYNFLMFFIGLAHWATSAKRFHDRDRSGWWILIEFTIIGIFWIIIELGCRSGTYGQNRFGPDPLKYKVVRNRVRG